jgi:hypothetical protein
MSNIDDGGQAFPVQTPEYGGMPPSYVEGMSLRDWFAGQMMAALIAAYDEINYEAAALRAYRRADAMLKARKVPQFLDDEP